MPPTMNPAEMTLEEIYQQRSMEMQVQQALRAELPPNSVDFAALQSGLATREMRIHFWNGVLAGRGAPQDGPMSAEQAAALADIQAADDAAAADKATADAAAAAAGGKGRKRPGTKLQSPPSQRGKRPPAKRPAKKAPAKKAGTR